MHESIYALAQENEAFKSLMETLSNSEIPEQAYVWKYNKKSNLLVSKAVREWLKCGDILRVRGEKLKEDHFYTYEKPDSSFIMSFLFADQ